MPAPVLDGLDPEQRLVAEALTGPVVVLAGAGTGKTRAITHRIAHAVQTGTHAAGNGLAVTFTNRAAGEMRQRLAGLGVQAVSVRTFHAAALSQLRYFWPTAVGGQFPDLVSSKAALVGQACREIGLPSSRPLVRDLAAEIEWAGSTMVSAGDYATVAAAAGRTPVGSGEGAIDLPGIARVMSAYQDVKSAAGAIDFEDVLLLMVALIGDRPDIADVIRSQYRWFTVDEYQDITPAQDRLLSGWLGDRDDVCVVGDASQTIYSFAGASPDALGEFARRWPNATEVRLDRCYRCTPEIVAVANSVIRSAAAGARGGVGGAGRPGSVAGAGPGSAGVGAEVGAWIVGCCGETKPGWGRRGGGNGLGDCRLAALPARPRRGSRDRAVRRRRRGGGRGRRPHRRPRRQRVRAPRHRHPHAHERRLGTDRGRVRGGEHPVHHARRRAVLRPARGPRGDRADARPRRRRRWAREGGRGEGGCGAAGCACDPRPLHVPVGSGRARGGGTCSDCPEHCDRRRDERPGRADPRRPRRDGLVVDRAGQRGSHPGALGVPRRGPGPCRGGRGFGPQHDVGAGRGVRAPGAAVARADGRRRDGHHPALREGARVAGRVHRRCR